jgi:acid stress chaperone HdeB
MRKSKIGLFVGAGLCLAGLALILEFSLIEPLEAQTSIDATKITCDELIRGRAAAPRTIVAWISGYMSAKRDTALIDPLSVRNHARELERYCYQQKNFKVPVMKAMEELAGQKVQ